MRLTKKERSRLEALVRCGKVVEVETATYARLREAGLVTLTPLRPDGVLIELTLAGRAAL